MSDESKSKKKKVIIADTPAEEQELIRRKLGHYTTVATTRDWLNTGSRRLNATLGSRELGIPYGKMLELHGWESHGKTLLMTFLMARAQKDGATVGLLDAENAYDPEWAKRMGLDTDRVYLFQPRVGRFSQSRGESGERLQTAEELCAEVEAWMDNESRKNPGGKVFLGVDSVTAFLPRDEAEAGLENQNMSTKVGLAKFMKQLLRRWTAVALTNNVMMVFINQLMMRPGVSFGNPEATAGGNALKFFCAVRAKVHRVKGGRMIKSGAVVGVKAVVTNVKNKAGGASVEGKTCGFKYYFDSGSWRFVSAEDLRREAAEK
ncbi:MAG: hypothetical protein KGL39_44605 [Patescibacteria group bacterium]|nr:hypothetical protein [Patescibacteria group bacterium]